MTGADNFNKNIAEQLREQGFKWVYGGNTDRVDPSFIKNVSYDGENITIEYTSKSVLLTSRAKVMHVELSITPQQWHLVHVKDVEDTRRPTLTLVSDEDISGGIL